MTKPVKPKTNIMTADTNGRRRVVNLRPHPEQQRPFVINKGRTVDAIYVTPEVPEWADNPLICALPRALDIVQAGERLAHEPKYYKHFRTQPEHVRRLL